MSYSPVESFIGEIRLFAGDYEPAGWAFCSGQTLQVAQNQALYAILGPRYGGDGRSTFQLPNLAPLNEADGGETPIRYIISLGGVWPSRGD